MRDFRIVAFYDPWLDGVGPTGTRSPTRTTREIFPSVEETRVVVLRREPLTVVRRQLGFNNGGGVGVRHHEAEAGHRADRRPRRLRAGPPLFNNRPRLQSGPEPTPDPLEG